MIIGVPKEIKNLEFRVGLTPTSVRELTARGAQVLVEPGAGDGSGFGDDAYLAAGAKLAADAADVFRRADLIVKVKEPQPQECALLREGQLLFTYLHLAAGAQIADALIASGCTAVAYETVTDTAGHLPLLTPMSEVAGRMSIQVGAHCLEKVHGGSGVLLAGVPGVEPGKVTVIGGGVAGENAIRMAVGLGADVTVLEKSVDRMRELESIFGARLRTVFSTEDAIQHHVAEADLVIGAVLVPGRAAPKLVTRDMIAAMRPGSVVVDIAIDQGGCFETSRPTSHAEPTYEVDGVIHYCVTNIPGAVPRTSTTALNNATLPFVLEIAEKGIEQATADNPHLAAGVNVCRGRITHPAVATDLNLPYRPAEYAKAG